MTDHPLILRVTRDGTAPEVERPDPAKVVAGDPVHSTWNLEDDGGLYCGLWQSTPGAWRVDYAEWEYVHILQGHSILTGEDGSVTHLRAGDGWIIRPGFRGTWEVVETTLKEYVIRS
ncbi:MAG: cupin domain-containing protein [Paracoccaceae bacterium]|nr:MAG: cupin domain-containing protein [Paracoccaceae bacterium]